LLRHYTAATGSAWGRELVQDFGRYAGHFWLVKPRVAELGELLAGLREAA
jgi:glutamate synthase (NADPH/NADH) large chain